MTQDEIIEMARQVGFEIDCCSLEWHKRITAFAKLVVAKALAKEKTLQALHSENERLALYKDAYAQPKPVAWVAEDVCEGQYINGRPRKIWWECKEGVGTAFYTHSLQRTWVGLTDEEIKTICSENGWDSSWQSLRFAQDIEAKLKEKNT